jgi:Bacterial PH domain
VTLRPRRARRVCFGLAAFIVILFAALGTVLSGPTGAEDMAFFRRSDQYAMGVLGLLIAAGILVFARPRIVADQRHVRVRNLLGSVDVPWEVVRSVRFNRGSPWASLELQDDDLISLLALQAVDKQYAVEGVRALRALLAVHRASLATDAGTSSSA